MGRKSSSSNRLGFVAPGMAIGAALGLLFGLMLFENGIITLLGGAVLGAMIGGFWEAYAKRNQRD